MTRTVLLGHTELIASGGYVHEALKAMEVLSFFEVRPDASALLEGALILAAAFQSGRIATEVPSPLPPNEHNVLAGLLGLRVGP